MQDLGSDALSNREIRRKVGALPRERRKDIVASIREGRVVRDPRDAQLAAAWADQLAAKAERTPSWLFPLARPRGRRAWLWVVHLVWIIGALIFLYVRIWQLLPGIWRWVLIGFLVYGVVTWPFTMRQILRTYWNAPEAARLNRQLARDAPAS